MFILILSMNCSYTLYRTVGMHLSFDINPLERIGLLSTEASEMSLPGGSAAQAAFHKGPGRAMLGPSWASVGPNWGPFVNAAWVG